MRSPAAAIDNWIWGLHSVEAALENYPEIFLDLMVELRADAKVKDKILSRAREQGVKVKEVNSLPKSLAEKRHQGVVALIKSFPLQVWDEKAFAQNRESFLAESPHMALLDEVQDPRNFGAILRSAAAFGVKRIFIGSRNQAPLSGVVAQASAGNLFRIEIVEVRRSLAELVKFLREEALLTLALDADGENLEDCLQNLQQRGAAKRPEALVWILGSEGRGLRSGLAKNCEKLVSIPMAPGVESLNVSAAATLAFYLGQKVFS